MSPRTTPNQRIQCPVIAISNSHFQNFILKAKRTTMRNTETIKSVQQINSLSRAKEHNLHSKCDIKQKATKLTTNLISRAKIKVKLSTVKRAISHHQSLLQSVAHTKMYITSRIFHLALFIVRCQNCTHRRSPHKFPQGLLKLGLHQHTADASIFHKLHMTYWDAFPGNLDTDSCSGNTICPLW